MRTAFEMNNRALILNIETKMLKSTKKKINHLFASEDQRTEIQAYLTEKGYIASRVDGPGCQVWLTIYW